MSKTRSSIIGVRISSDSCYDYDLEQESGFIKTNDVYEIDYEDE